MEVACSIVCKLAEYAVAPIGRTVGYLSSYRSNIQELAHQVKKLRDAREKLENEVEEEERNGLEIADYVVDWLVKVEQIEAETEKLLENPNLARAECSRWPLPNLNMRLKLSRKAKKMAYEVDELMNMGKFDRISYRLPRVLPEMMSSVRDEIESRELIKNDMMQALQDPNISIIGVYGLGGVGKTTLAKQVAMYAKEHKLVDAIVFAVVSTRPDVRKIQSDLADQLGLRLDEESSVGRAFRLRQRIRQEKTILIVLDDIWAKLDLDSLGIPLGHNNHGCKILLTSRNQHVLDEMVTQKSFKLEILDEEETWSLFEEMAGDDVRGPNLRSTAIKVAKRSEGLPLLAVVIAGALKNKGIDHWKYALEKLSVLEIDQMVDKTYYILKLSYDRLENDETKALFLLCGAFRQVSFSDLLKYVRGLRLFECLDTGEDARNRLHRSIDVLKASCLLVEDDTRTHVKMHPILREVALSIASRDQYIFTTTAGGALREWPTQDLLNRFTQLIVDPCYAEQLPERLDCPQLKILYLRCPNDCSLEIPDSFFEGMGSLQVLDLRYMKTSLPTSFRFLNKLKTLCLIECSLHDMAEIKALKNLETLSLKESSMTMLPTQLGLLENLTMLDLSGCEIEVFPVNVISKLNKLEELYMGNASIKQHRLDSIHVDELGHLPSLIVELKHLPSLIVLEIRVQESQILPREMLENLERYNIVVGDVRERSDSKPGVSKTLKLKLQTGIHLKYGINELIKSVEELCLDEISGLSNVLFELNAEGFPLLKHLHIQNNKRIQHIINSEDWYEANASFPNLETLSLVNLNNLEKICHGPVAFDSFRRLTFIKIQQCGQLQNLFPFSMFEGLHELMELEVSDCNSLKKIVDFSTSDVAAGTDADKFVFQVQPLRSLTLQHLPQLLGFLVSELTSSTTSEMPFLNTKVEFPRLESLKLCSIKIKRIFEDESVPACVGNLSSLIVEDCSDLKFVLSSSIAENMLKLKRLEISNCPNVDGIIKATEGTHDSNKVAFPNLDSLKLSSLNLKKIWDKNDQISASFLRNLTSLIMEDCNNLKYLFTPSIVGGLSKLKHLQIRRCNMMVTVLKATEERTSNTETEVLFPKLQKIIICEMENLETIWQWHQPPASNSFGRLKWIEIRDCVKIVTIFSQV